MILYIRAVESGGYRGLRNFPVIEPQLVAGVTAGKTVPCICFLRSNPCLARGWFLNLFTMKFKILSQTDKDAIKEHIDKLPEGKAYNVEITLSRPKRSMDQNRLYWLWLNHIAKEGDFGYTAEELHCVFAQKFLGARQRVMYGEQVLSAPSTRKLTKEEFTTYLERIEVFSNTELGIQLPIPQDKIFEQYYELYKDVI